MASTRRTRRRSGVAAVELAVLLPFLVFAFLAAVDFGRVIYYTITIDNCLHNGAVFASQTFDNQNQQWIGNNQYWQGPNGQLISAVSAATDLDGTNLTPSLGSSNISVSSGTDSLGNPVVNVTITYTFTTLVPYPGIPSSLTISRTMQARVAPPVPSS